MIDMKTATALALSLIALTLPLNLRASGDDPLPPPIEFRSELATFIDYADDVAALRAWFENLTPEEQATHRSAFEAAVRELEAREDMLFSVLADQMTDQHADSHLYLLFDTIRGMDPIKARTVFSRLVDKIAGRINHDYVNDPTHPDKARRARDLQAIRSYIGRSPRQ